MPKIIILTIATLLLPISLCAEELASDNLVKQLEADIEKYSSLAIETRQNVDYMPYVISVLTSDELQSLGVFTLRDALHLIPGVDLSVGMAGVKNPIFRGSNPYAMGQSKLLIDGVVVNDSLFGAYNQYLDMPTHIIQRIEVVRGPGSLSSHINGYAGSIHVITKANRDDGLAKQDEIFIAGGSNDYAMGGFISSHQQGAFEISTDVFYQEHKLVLPVGADVFGNSGDTNQSLENYQLGLNASFEGFSLKSRFAKNNSGVSYGQSFSYSEDPDDFLDVANNFVELSYKFPSFNHITTQFSIGYFDEHRTLQNKVLPDGSMLMMPPPPTPLPDGRYFLVDYSEKTLFERLEFKISTFENHDITTGLYLYQSQIDNNSARISDDGLQTLSPPFDLLIDTERNLVSTYFDDLINLNEKSSVQIGLKYDRYNDVDSQLSPRVAFVYRYNNENIYKLMYTSSYREPSWREQYLKSQTFFNATLDTNPETVDAYEAAYIHKFSIQSQFNLNFFYLNNKDQIHAQNTNNAFQNSGDGELYGFEAEYKTQFMKNNQFYINYSYVDGSNVADTLTNSASNMIKAYYIHNINTNLSLSGIAKYIDEKQRIETDSRSPVESYYNFDLTAQYKIQASDLTTTVSLKNIFNTEYYLPSPNNRYPGDFQQEGRSIIFSLKKGF